MTLVNRSPIVDSIVLNLIKEVYFEKFRFSKKETIDSKIVPSISKSVLSRRGFNESSYPGNFTSTRQIPPFSLPKKDKPSKPTPAPMVQKVQESNLPQGFQKSILEDNSPKDKTESIKPPITNNLLKISQVTNSETIKALPSNIPLINQSRQIQKPRPLQPLQTPHPLKSSNLQQSAQIPPQSLSINLFQNPPNYGKLNMVLKDPFVNYIDCPGPDQRIIVTRNGQKQQTNIILTKDEIKMLLNNISTKTKIPLITGVFRVSWDNFVINAVISDTLEPRFVMKKG